MMKTLIENYGMLLVLLALCILFSILTIKEQNSDSDSAANKIVKNIQLFYAQNDIILTVGALNKDSEPFAVSLKEKLELEGLFSSKKKKVRAFSSQTVVIFKISRLHYYSKSI